MKPPPPPKSKRAAPAKDPALHVCTSAHDSTLSRPRQLSSCLTCRYFDVTGTEAHEAVCLKHEAPVGLFYFCPDWSAPHLRSWRLDILQSRYRSLERIRAYRAEKLRGGA